MENLKPSTPTFRVGKRTFALEQRVWKGKPQLGLLEVVPVVTDMTVTGWQPVFKGVRLSGTPQEVQALAAWLSGLVV